MKLPESRLPGECSCRSEACISSRFHVHLVEMPPRIDIEESSEGSISRGLPQRLWLPSCKPQDDGQLNMRLLRLMMMGWRVSSISSTSALRAASSKQRCSSVDLELKDERKRKMKPAPSSRWGRWVQSSNFQKIQNSKIILCFHYLLPKLFHFLITSPQKLDKSWFVCDGVLSL